MKDVQLARRVSYPKIDEIDRLFFEKFGLAVGKETDPQKAEVLNLGWLTMYRIREGIGKHPNRRPYRASNEVITALVVTFPDSPYTQLFDTREDVA
jgi:hypothetical protein